MSFGRKKWAIAEGYIPTYSTADSKDLISHDAVCILNTNNTEANIEITVYFTDKDPVGPFKIKVGAKRSKHIRFNELKDPATIPLGVEYSSTIEADVPIIVQHTRLDSRQPANAIMTTIAYSE